MYIAKRQDGSFETLVNGLPYHVMIDDPLYPDLAEAYADLPAGKAEVDGKLLDDFRGLSGWVNNEPYTVTEFGPLPEDWSYTPPPLTLEERKEAFTRAIDAYMNAFASERGYDSMASAASYAGDDDPAFAAEGAYAKRMRSLIYRASYAILDDVLAGKRPMPTIEEVLAELPALEWPEVAV